MPENTTLKRLHRKLTWTWNPRSERESGDSIVRNILLHWFPNKVSLGSLSWSYSMWLGTISFVLFVILTVTGVILMFFYVPSVERAYGSIKDIQYVISFGWLLRAIHRVAAHLMVASVFLHMMRVFLTGAYKNGPARDAKRPVNWIIGIVLLLCTFLLSFTGYLLPWDQLAFWAITVGTNIGRAAPVVGDWLRFILLGGNTIDQPALLRFYVLHVFALPTVVFLLFLYHMWRIRKDGGLAIRDKELLTAKPAPTSPVLSKTYSLLGIRNGTSVHVQTKVMDEEANTVLASPNLTRRIWLVSLATIVLTVVLALVFGAPLEAPANPSVTPNPAKAPWYFLWLQEIVTITTIKLGFFTINGALIGGVILPGLLVMLGVAWPYVDKSGLGSVGVWMSRERRVQNSIFLAVCIVIAILTIIGTFLRGPYWGFYWPWQGWPEAPLHF